MCGSATVFVDTGASVSLMSLSCFQRIRDKRVLVLDPPDIRLCEVSSSPKSSIGKQPFVMYLLSDVAPLPVAFYIVDGINLLADILLGSPDLTKNNVDIFLDAQMLRHRPLVYSVPPVFLFLFEMGTFRWLVIELCRELRQYAYYY